MNFRSQNEVWLTKPVMQERDRCVCHVHIFFACMHDSPVNITKDMHFAWLLAFRSCGSAARALAQTTCPLDRSHQLVALTWNEQILKSSLENQ